MTSLALAWVIVTIIKRGDLEISFSPMLFVITGMVDVLIALAIFADI